MIAASPSDPRLAEPELEVDEQYYYWVFNQLSRDRRYDQGYPYPLSLQAFNEYAQLFDDRLETEEVLLLQEMDNGFLEAMSKNRET